MARQAKCKLVILFFLRQDNNGTIENEELRGFLKDLLELVKKVYFYQITYLVTFIKYVYLLGLRCSRSAGFRGDDPPRLRFQPRWQNQQERVDDDSVGLVQT